MIVQTIEISLSKGRAPDLLAHVAETGREIEMIPDVEISADDYTAEIDTVKPDGTFTMTNCSIDADGHIIAPIIEQAVAVKGLCHYIIKIYNDDVVVYSACGSLWVDDHLVTDDMIESIAEVNGDRFPQDFVTFDDLPSFDIINDNVLADDKTWSSNKINNEIASRTAISYSTEERVVGTWLNGKSLYQKTLTGTINIPSYTRTWFNIALINDIANVIPVPGSIITTRGNNHTIPIPSAFGLTVGNVIACDYDETSKNVRILADGFPSSIGDYIVTIQYTKTTD